MGLEEVVVVVTFLDTTTYDFWATAEEVAKTECKLCVAIGMLVSKNDKIVKVALLGSKDEQGRTRAFSNWVDIPTSCIISCEGVKTIEEENGQANTNPYNL